MCELEKLQSFYQKYVKENALLDVDFFDVFFMDFSKLINFIDNKFIHESSFYIVKALDNIYHDNEEILDPNLPLYKAQSIINEIINTRYLNILFILFYAYSNEKKNVDINLFSDKVVYVIECNLGNGIDSTKIIELFSRLNNDEMILNLLEKMYKSNIVRPLMEDNLIALSTFKFINDENKRLEVALKFFSDRKIEDQIIERHLRRNILNKKLLMTHEMIPFYKKHKLNIAYIVSGDEIDAERFRLDEEKYYKEDRLEELIDKYKNVGIIDDETLEEITEFAKTYRSKITVEDVKRRIGKSKNARDLIEYLASSDKESKTYKDILDKFKAIYPKTRFEYIPSNYIFVNMPLDFFKKFKLDVWRKMSSIPLFKIDKSTNLILANIVMFTGIFEEDLRVSSRIVDVYNLFSNYNLPIDERIYRIFDKSIMNEDYFDEVDVIYYKLREEAIIPDDLINWLSETIDLDKMKKIKKLTGNIGSEISKFLSPYKKTDNIWKLKRGITLTKYQKMFLKEIMTNEEYIEILESEDVNEDIKTFISPYMRVSKKCYKIREDLSSKDYEFVMNKLLCLNINGRYNSESLRRIFENIQLKYDENFYNFFMSNQDEILSDDISQLLFKQVQLRYKRIKKYYVSHGNLTPDYLDMIAFIEKIPYEIEFGNEEFARECKSNKVSNEGYISYEKLLPILRSRKLSTIPRIDKKYLYEYDGEQFPIHAKVLSMTDYTNLLVGETKYTNCCQRYGGLGYPCVKHAACEQNGGIFATYIIVDNTAYMLTQSWIWTNEGKLCFDNIEGTNILKSASPWLREILSNGVAYAIRCAVDDMHEESLNAVEKYIKDHEISEEEANKVRRKQILNSFTVGDGLDDLGVREIFPEYEVDARCYPPKNYNNYRDSMAGEQHIIKKFAEVDFPDNEYKDIPLFRDPRIVIKEHGNNIKYYSLRRIVDMNDKYNNKFKDVAGLAAIFKCDVDSLNVIIGEDFYFIYKLEGEHVDFLDVHSIKPRLDDELSNQLLDMYTNFAKLISENKSIYINTNSEAYLLYLLYKRRKKEELDNNNIEQENVKCKKLNNKQKS